VDGDSRSDTNVAAHRDCATVCLDDRPHDREPEARALDVRGRRGAEEAFEESYALVLRNADAGVPDLQMRGFVRGRDSDEDAAPRGRELDRIREQVVEYLGQPGGIAMEADRAIQGRGDPDRG